MMKIFKGFSLIELLIVVAIIGILAAIAFPSYSHYFIRQKRFAAEVTLFRVASALDEYYNSHNTYKDVDLEKLGFPIVIADNNYSLKIDATDNDYLLSAIPINTQTKDIECGELKLSSLGEKTITGNGKVNSCW